MSGADRRCLRFSSRRRGVRSAGRGGWRFGAPKGKATARVCAGAGAGTAVSPSKWWSNNFASDLHICNPAPFGLPILSRVRVGVKWRCRR